MFCGQCGHKIPDGAKFCPRCGAHAAQTVDTSDAMEDTASDQLFAETSASPQEEEPREGLLQEAVGQRRKSLFSRLPKGLSILFIALLAIFATVGVAWAAITIWNSFIAPALGIGQETAQPVEEQEPSPEPEEEPPAEPTEPTEPAVMSYTMETRALSQGVLDAYAAHGHDYRGDDGFYEMSYPVFSSENRPEVAERMNVVVEEMLGAWDEEALETAEADMENTSPELFATLTVDVTSEDDDYLSLNVTGWISNNGGAGMAYNGGRTFDLTEGEEVPAYEAIGFTQDEFDLKLAEFWESLLDVSYSENGLGGVFSPEMFLAKYGDDWKDDVEATIEGMSVDGTTLVIDLPNDIWFNSHGGFTGRLDDPYDGTFVIEQ